MTERTMTCVLLALLCVAGTIAAYQAWLPDVSELSSKNLMATRYVQIYVRRVLRRGGRPATAMKWVPLERISPYLRHSVMIAEDARFYEHRGVDWRAVQDAMDYNIRKRRLARGGSTITQQVARNLFLSPSRSVGRKLKEVLIARHMERSLSKDRILEIYLNIVEWGEGVFGAEAASRVYFDKSASELTPQEAVALAAALPSPYERHPGKEPDERMRKLRRVYLERLRRAGVLGEEGMDADRIIQDNTQRKR